MSEERPQLDEQMRALVAGCPVAMLVASPEGRALYGNPAALRLLGYRLDELKARTMLDIVAPDDIDARPLDDRRLEGGVPAENERPLLRADGSHVWVKTTTQRMPNGHLLFWLRDLSEQRRLEAQLGEAQKFETVGLLAAGLAHDLNNLLTVVSGHAELLRIGPDEAITQRSAECIALAAERAAELTRKVLAFGRKQILRPRTISLNDIVQKNLELMRSMAGERIEVHVDLAADLDFIEADPLQVEQALWNLVTNGCQAMERGGRLTVRTANVELDETARDGLSRPRPDPRFVALSVEDTGSGMHEHTLRRMFDPFFTTKQAGSGLGLSVVQGVVAQSGGLVRVRSSPGAGSRFEMCFPRSDPPPPSQSQAPTVHKAPLVGTLLVVENDLLVRTWLTQALERRGLTVRAARDGEEALALAHALPTMPLAVVTDVNMPRLDGPDLVRRLRRTWPLVPALFITGYAEDAVLRALPAGSDLLTKPFTAAALLERLERLCGA